MPFDFSADHIAAAAGGYEPQRLNHFSILFAGLPQSDVIEKSLLSFQPPNREISEITIPYANEDRKVAGKVTVSEASLVIVDYSDKDTWQTFHDWLNLVHNVRTGALGLASEYKKEGIVSYYGPNGERKRSWTCQGCWPKSVQPEQFSMDSGERNNLTVPLCVDRVLPSAVA